MVNKKPRVKKKLADEQEKTEKPLKNTREPRIDKVMDDKNKESIQSMEITELQGDVKVTGKDESKISSPESEEVKDHMQPASHNDSALEEAPVVPTCNESVDTPEEKGRDASQSMEPAAFSSASATIQMLSHSNEKLRIEAIESLLRIADKSISYAFVSAMKDESFRVRLGALRGLYKFGGEMATEYLIKALDDIHPDVRRRALIYLGWMRKKELIPYVTSALADDSSRVRRVATYALSDIKDPAAVPYLMKALDDGDQEVVKGAIAALKRITGESFSSEQKEQDAAQKEIVAYYKEWWVKQNK